MRKDVGFSSETVETYTQSMVKCMEYIVAKLACDKATGDTGNEEERKSEMQRLRRQQELVQMTIVKMLHHLKRINRDVPTQ